MDIVRRPKKKVWFSSPPRFFDPNKKNRGGISKNRHREFSSVACVVERKKNWGHRIHFFSMDLRTWHVFLPFYVVYIEL